MPDTRTPQQRHANMAAIHGKDTKPEMIVRRWLWRHGYRYRLNHPRLPGKPDVVMRKYRTCIFINGCFWHGHGVMAVKSALGSGESFLERNDLVTSSRYSEGGEPGEGVNREQWGMQGAAELEDSACCKIPRTNRAFWVQKIRRNQERDREVQHKLAAMGWHSITIWECELKPKLREKTLESLAYTLNRIFLQDHHALRYELPEEAPLMAAEEVAEYHTGH